MLCDGVRMQCDGAMVLCDAVPVLYDAVSVLPQCCVVLSLCCALLWELEVRAQVVPCDVILPELLFQTQTLRAVLELTKQSDD
jgi:hypothetical protein